ncbi:MULTISPECIES: hypothetical protein [unclassified Acinetobacter]|uniref:hypothetical protein n=1 Tax=unclassified Acinetobacter TaxID=196816 RepID=UPI0012508F9F|nr:MULTISPECIES: hypothetical protein [unclassified Acinetobacter]
MNKNQFKRAAIQFQLAVHSIKHLLGYVSYSFDQVCFIESGTTKDHEFAATVVNSAWDAWLVQQRKLDAKDKLLTQLHNAANSHEGNIGITDDPVCKL